MKKNATGMSTKAKAITAGVGVAALAAAGAAAYFFTGKGGKENRAKVKAWGTKAKKEVVAELKKMEKVSEKAYHQVVDMVMDKYHQAQDIDKEDVIKAAKELKAHWKSISAHMKSAVNQGAKTAKATVNKAAKKVAKATK